MCSVGSIKIPIVTYIRAIIAFSSSIRRRPIRMWYRERERERERRKKKTVRIGSIFTVLFDPNTHTHTHTHTHTYIYIHILESHFPLASWASEYTDWFTAAQCDVLHRRSYSRRNRPCRMRDLRPLSKSIRETRVVTSSCRYWW
jgi:hypothetical protein